MFKLDGKTLPQGVAFEHNGIQYPANWLNLTTLKEKEAIGITEVPEQPRPNDKYYWVSEDGEGGYTTIPKDIFSLQNQMVTEINQQAYNLIQPSDWKITRFIEQGIPVSESWSTYRQSVRDTANKAIDLMTACKTVEDLIALPVIDWPHDPNWVEPVTEETPVNV